MAKYELPEDLKTSILDGIHQSKILTAGGKEEKVFDFGKRIWTSGLIHGVYTNHRVIDANPSLRRAVDQANVLQVQHYLAKNGYDSDEVFIASSADAGISWGAHVARMLEVPFVVMRKNEKIMGAIPAKRMGIVVDDLNSTYSTFGKVVDAIEREGAFIHHGFFNVDYGLYQPQILEKLEEKAIGTTANVTGDEVVAHGIAHYFTEGQKAYAESLLKSLDGFALKVVHENPGWVKSHDRFEKAIEYYRNQGKEEIQLALEALL